MCPHAAHKWSRPALHMIVHARVCFSWRRIHLVSARRLSVDLSMRSRAWATTFFISGGIDMKMSRRNHTAQVKGTPRNWGARRVDLALADGRPWYISYRTAFAGGAAAIKAHNANKFAPREKHAEGQSTAVNAHRSARAIVAHEAKIERMKGRKKWAYKSPK